MMAKAPEHSKEGHDSAYLHGQGTQAPGPKPSTLPLNPGVLGYSRNSGGSARPSAHHTELARGQGKGSGLGV